MTSLRRHSTAHTIWLKGEVPRWPRPGSRLWPASLTESGKRKSAPDGRTGRNRAIVPFHHDPVGYVVSANLHRRHLTREQKRDLIGKLLRANPEKLDRATAKITQVDDRSITVSERS